MPIRLPRLHSSSSHPTILIGEVAETFQRGGSPVARIVMRSGCLEVPAEGFGELHLGDRIVINVSVTIRDARVEDTIRDNVATTNR